MNPNQPQSLLGYKLVSVPNNVPKMQLSADCSVTDSFRAAINAWMIEFFGCANILKDGECLIQSGVLHMNPITHQSLNRITKEHPIGSFF